MHRYTLMRTPAHRARRAPSAQEAARGNKEEASSCSLLCLAWWAMVMMTGAASLVVVRTHVCARCLRSGRKRTVRLPNATLSVPAVFAELPPHRIGAAPLKLRLKSFVARPAFAALRPSLRSALRRRPAECGGGGLLGPVRNHPVVRHRAGPAVGEPRGGEKSGRMDQGKRTHRRELRGEISEVPHVLLNLLDGDAFVGVRDKYSREHVLPKSAGKTGRDEREFSLSRRFAQVLPSVRVYCGDCWTGETREGAEDLAVVGDGRRARQLVLCLHDSVGEVLVRIRAWRGKMRERAEVRAQQNAGGRRGLCKPRVAVLRSCTAVRATHRTGSRRTAWRRGTPRRPSSRLSAVPRRRR